MASTSDYAASTRQPETDPPGRGPRDALSSSSSMRQSSKLFLSDDNSEATPEPPAPPTPPPSGSAGPPADDEPGTPSAAALASLSCPICCDVLLAPVVTPCGHAYCLACFEAWRKHAGGSWPHTAPGPFAAPVLCPVCRAPLPHALTSPSARRPLAPCAALSDAVAALCPQQLRERQQRAQLEASSSSSSSTHSLAGGEGSSSSAGWQQGGAQGGGWGHEDGGAGGGLPGGRWWRRLQRWAVGRWRTVLRGGEQLPPLEAVLGAVLLGTYAAAWTFILMQGVRGARRKVWGFLSGRARRGGRQQGRGGSVGSGPCWWVSVRGPLSPGSSGLLQMQMALLRMWWRAAAALAHDHPEFWRAREAASMEGRRRGLGSWQQLLELPASLLAASAVRSPAQAAKAGLRGAGRQGVAGAGWRADRRWAERVAGGGQAAGRELGRAAAAMAAGTGTGWAARRGE